MSNDNQELPGQPSNLALEEQALLGAMQESFDNLREPRIDRVLDKVRAASDIMQIIPSRPSEQSQVIDELDQLWMEGGVEQSILVRGKITYEVKTENGKEDRTAILWDSEVISNGFTVEALTEIDQETHTRLAKIVHHFTVPTSSVPEKFKKSEITATADLDVIVDTNEVSTERAYVWLKALYPAFIEEVDRRVIACQSETAILLALKGIVIADWIDVSNPRARNCVETFLGMYVTVDTDASYGVLCDGDVAIMNDSYELQAPFTVEYVDTLADISPPRLFQLEPNAENAQWQVGIFIETKPQDLSVARVKYAIPLSSIEDITSVRRMYYSQ